MSTKTPTNETLRIAVCELMGWEILEGPTPFRVGRKSGVNGGDWTMLPALDHNTLADARKELLTTDARKYRFAVLLGMTILGGKRVLDDWDLVDAAPEPQVIALCKVFGKDIK